MQALQVHHPSSARLSSSRRVWQQQQRSRVLSVPARITLAPPPAAWSRRQEDSKPAQQQSWNPVEVVKREQGLQSNRLPQQVREKVSSAVEELRFRVTVGDVAGRAGLKVQEADEALKALAYDSKANLEVGEQGDVVYAFPRDFQASIRARSVFLSAQPALNAVGRGVKYLTRVLFGTALFASVAVVWAAIAAIMLGSRRDDDRRGNGNGSNGYYYNNGYNGGGMRFYFNLADLFSFMHPSYGVRNYERAQQGEQLSFIESIFSFVFGDGDPNAGYDAQRWAALGRLIQSRGGVVTAEEMAPFLDPPERPEPSETGVYKDESFVLPALIRFGGEPSVDPDTGVLLYKFPALQVSGVTSERIAPDPRRAPPQRPTSFTFGRPQPSQAPQPAGGAVSYDAGLEQSWELTSASAGSIFGVVLLGVFNFVGVLTLQGMLRDPHAFYALREWGLGWVGAAMPALQLYASTFFAIPAIRAVVNAWRNSGVMARNGARQQAAKLLAQNANASGPLRRKLEAARQEGATRTVRQGDVVFTTAKDVGEQANEREIRDWDKQFLGQDQAPRSSRYYDDPLAPPAPPLPPQQRQQSSRPPAQGSRSAAAWERARQERLQRDYDGRYD